MNFRAGGCGSLIALGIIAVALPIFIQNDYLMQVFFRIALFRSPRSGMENLVGGYAGQLSLGHAAFFGLGAYGLAIASAHGVPHWIAFILAPLLATVFAAIIGKIVFRLRGPYFTLSTIAFGEVSTPYRHESGHHGRSHRSLRFPHCFPDRDSGAGFTTARYSAGSDHIRDQRLDCTFTLWLLPDGYS